MNRHCHPSNGKRWIFWGFLAIAAFFLWAEHQAHVLGALPYLLLLACPLMHLLHGHGHGHHDHRDEQDEGRTPPSAPTGDDTAPHQHKHD